MTPDILIYAAIAAVILWRLWVVLGRRNEEDGSRPNPFDGRPAVPPAPPKAKPPLLGGPADAASDVPVLPPIFNLAPTSLEGGIAQLKTLDPAFDEREFLRQAKTDFAAIIADFAAGDLTRSAPKLGPLVSQNFTAAIAARKQAGQKLVNRITRMVDVETAAVRLDGTNASITVRFVSEQENYPARCRRPRRRRRSGEDRAADRSVALQPRHRCKRCGLAAGGNAVTHRSARRLAALGAVLLVAACATSAPPPSTPSAKAPAERLTLTPVGFDALPGWAADRQSAALPALAKSCGALTRKTTATLAGTLAGTGADWQPVCAALPDVPPGDDAAARAFLTRWFQPYAASADGKADGLFTGYYEPELRGARQQGGPYQTPLYARPGDLVTVDLGSFLPELKGKHIAGKVAQGKLAVYDDRAAIAGGSLTGRAEPLLWVDDPTDAFFLEVQGSGRVQLADGSLVTVGYDAANGRHYTAIGGALAARGAIDKPVTMHKIRGWLRTIRRRRRRRWTSMPLMFSSA